MPRIDVTYTPNLDGLLDVGRLVNALHEAAQGLGIFPPFGLRTMATRAERSRIGDGHDRAYVQVDVRTAPGRAPEVKQQVIETLYAVIEENLGAVPHPHLRYQLELTEFDAALTRAGGAV